MILRDEVEKRQQDARDAAINRDRLSEQLSDSESKFAKFATRAPVGLAILTPDGVALSANDLWLVFPLPIRHTWAVFREPRIRVLGAESEDLSLTVDVGGP